MALPPQLLVVLDLNGTILDSTHKRRAGVTHDAMARSKFVYFRPGMKQFLGELFSHPSIRVAIWTSNIASNANAILEIALTPAQRERLAFVYSREHCIVSTSGDHSSKKPMRKIYDLGFCPERTIIVDDSESKIDPPDTPGWIRVSEFIASPDSIAKDRALSVLLANIVAIVSQ